MKLKKEMYFSFALLFLIGGVLGGIIVQTGEKDKAMITIIPRSSDYDDESPGIAIDGTNLDVFTLCRDNLYFYNTSNNGTLYKVNLNSQPFIPQIVRGHLGDVLDIDSSYGSGGDLIFLATTEYNYGIMKLNTSILTYQKILSSQWAPQKLSVEFFSMDVFERIDLTWRTASNVFYWNSNDAIIKNIGPDFPNVIDVQYEGVYVLYYNSTEIRLYDRLSDSISLYIYGDGITSVYLDYSRDYIIYAQDDDYDYDEDGQIIQFDYDESTFTYIQLGVDYPVSVWCTPNYVYWIERGYWSSHSIIYRYSYYYDPPNTHYYSKVSRAHGVMWADSLQIQDELYPNQGVLGVYWGYDQLFVINGSDITSPDIVDWSSSNHTLNYDDWQVSWWNSYDLNDIDKYELIVSNYENFSVYDTYWVNESESSLTSLLFENMVYGDYYYKIRAYDTTEQQNVCQWSDILYLSYPSPPPDGGLPIGIPGYSLLMILFCFGIVTTIYYRKRFKF